jgi:uncharacterized repeat protein (TIGR01451 family)
MSMKNRLCGSLVPTLMLLAALPALAAPGAHLRAVGLPSIQADISVYGSGPETTTPGADITFFIVVSCLGPDTSGPVTYSWATPPGTSFLSLQLIALDPPARPAPTDCTTPPVGSPGTVTCSVSSLAPPGTGPFGGGTLSIQLIHMRVLASSGFVTNTVTAMSANDPNPANNTMSVSTAIIGSGSTDVALALTGPSVVGPDGGANYGITVRNNGPATASNVRLEFAAPAGATIDSFNAGSLDCYQTPIPPAVECNTGTAPPGWSTSLTVNTHVTVPAGGTVTAGSHVTADGGDTVPSNNDASWTSLAGTPTGLDLEFDPATVDAAPSLPFTFTARLGNSSGSPLGPIDLVDVLPAVLTLVSATPSSGTCNVTGSTVECRMDLAPGAAATIAFVATSATTGTLSDRIAASTATQSASATVSINVLASSRHRAVGH